MVAEQAEGRCPPAAQKPRACDLASACAAARVESDEYRVKWHARPACKKARLAVKVRTTNDLIAGGDCAVAPDVTTSDARSVRAATSGLRAKLSIGD